MADDHARSRSTGGIKTGTSRRSLKPQTVTASDIIRPTSDAMRLARRRWASGVAIVTTFVDGDTVSYRGVTVNAFVVVSLKPAIVLICLQRGGEMADLVTTAGKFAISILDRQHESLADRFAGVGPLPDRRLTGIPHEVAPSGCPVIADALTWFDCAVLDQREAGDHVVVMGDVEALGYGPESNDPLLSFDGSYRRLEGD